MIEERRLEPLIRKPTRSTGLETREPSRRPPAAKKTTPPDQTNAEQFYYSKQMQSKTRMVVVLTDGEQLEGVIEWYDRDCLKLNRIGAPNLLLYKRSIKYMYKAEGD
ncbi:MAG TPA: RNA chaperone Hfq [Bryobacteraceae bacterium]|jgi:host factor-I protein|nr:RNA chaperone Hfq [Bryobacteraceae bacterium]